MEAFSSKPTQSLYLLVGGIAVRLLGKAGLLLGSRVVRLKDFFAWIGGLIGCTGVGLAFGGSQSFICTAEAK